MTKCLVCHQIDIVHEGIVTFYSTLPSGESNLLDITDYLLSMGKADIYNLGLVLGLRQTKLRVLRDSDSFLDDAISAWLRKEHQVTEKGDPSWTVLINALKHPRVDQSGIADNIAKDKGGLVCVIKPSLTNYKTYEQDWNIAFVARGVDV